MVNVRKVKGWILDGEMCPQAPTSDEQYFVECGVRKATVYFCGYCEEGWHLKEEDAEKCCSEDT